MRLGNPQEAGGNQEVFLWKEGRIFLFYGAKYINITKGHYELRLFGGLRSQKGILLSKSIQKNLLMVFTEVERGKNPHRECLCGTIIREENTISNYTQRVPLTQCTSYSSFVRKKIIALWLNLPMPLIHPALLHAHFLATINLTEEFRQEYFVLLSITVEWCLLFNIWISLWVSMVTEKCFGNDCSGPYDWKDNDYYYFLKIPGPMPIFYKLILL